MIKPKKKCVALLTSLAMILTITVQSTHSAFSATAGNNTQTDSSINVSTKSTYYDLNGEPGYIISAYRITASGVEEMDFGSFKKVHPNNRNQKNVAMINPLSLSGSINPINNMLGMKPQYFYLVPTYVQSGFISDFARYDLQSRISTYVCNETSSPMTRTKASLFSQTYTVNVFLTSTDKSALTAALGSSWSDNTTFSNTETVTVKPNQKEWAEFIPIMDNSFGFMKYYDSLTGAYVSENWVDLYIAKMAGDFTDGILLFKTASI